MCAFREVAVSDQKLVSDATRPLGRALSSRTHLDRVALAIFCLFVFSIPWEEQAAMTFPQGAAFSRLLGVLAFGFGIFAIAVRFYIRPISIAHYPMIAFVAWAGLSYLWTVSPDDTLSRITTYVQLSVMVWLCWQFACDRQQQATVLRAYVLGSCISAGGTILNFMSGHEALSRGLGGLQHTDETEAGRYVASGFNENELSLMLALSIPMSIYLFVTCRDKRWRVLYGGHMACVLIAILLTGSRGGLMATSVALLTLPLLSFGLSRSEKTIFVVGAAALTFFALSTIPQATWQRLLSTKTEITEGTLTKRTVIWDAGFQVFRENAYGGVGAGGYMEAVRGILDVPYAAHNTFLSILVELGAIGAAFFLMWAVALCTCIYVLGMAERRMWTVLLITWTVGVSSMTWEHRKPTWLLFALITAAAGAVTPRHDSSEVAAGTR